MLGIPFLDDAITKWFKPQAFDDPVDRLNYFITVGLDLTIPTPKYTNRIFPIQFQSTLLTFFALMVKR
jgi:hypothetical protein